MYIDLHDGIVVHEIPSCAGINQSWEIRDIVWLQCADKTKMGWTHHGCMGGGGGSLSKAGFDRNFPREGHCATKLLGWLQENTFFPSSVFHAVLLYPVWPNCTGSEQLVLGVGLTAPLCTWLLGIRRSRWIGSIKKSRNILTSWQASSVSTSRFSPWWKAALVQVRSSHYPLQVCGTSLHIYPHFFALGYREELFSNFLAFRGMVKNSLEEFHPVVFHLAARVSCQSSSPVASMS